MQIDSSHRSWMYSTLAALGVFLAAFILYAAVSANGPRGGSAAGILFGLAGYGLMVYAALLGLRKRVPVWRLGRAQTWMRGHLWLGLLSLPLILFHCGFRWRGPLASVLMILLFITIGSGIAGAAIQHFMPEFMTRAVPMETIYEEIPHVRRQLYEEADALVASISEGAEMPDVEIDPLVRARFSAAYQNTIRPLLQRKNPANRTTPEELAATFDSLRKMLPEAAQPVIEDLESICTENAQLQRQRHLYFWLHGWLLLHVPVSLALLTLGAIHAVVALRY